MEKSKKEQKFMNMRHSLSHLLAAAVLELWPSAKPTIGPAIDNGFYYDFNFDYVDAEKRGLNAVQRRQTQKISDKDLPKIEKEMKEILKKWDKFEKIEVSEKEAKEKFKNNPYKLELIDELVKDKQKIIFYKSGNFIDLCGGSHIDSAKKIKPDAFKLDRIAGAYWRGSEKNKMLTRIYGLAFETKKELDEHIKILEEAEKRDHRKLGKELELFMIDEDVGQGLPLWMPNGTILREEVEKFILEEGKKRDYQSVRTPHIASYKLFEKSGHLDFYKDGMYSPMDIENENYYVKPMNCPFHVKIYKSRIRSYRELPVRLAELGTVYRYERSGTLHGLTRVRGFTQDDAHIICAPEQLTSELAGVINLTKHILQTFGFKKFRVVLSVRDKKNKEKYLGSDKDWSLAENSLKKALEISKWNFETEEGEAVFYGPKIDVKVYDAVGREWQISTLQLDFNFPSKFDMTYMDKDGKEKRPFMLHRAIIGSLERFTGILIEHYGGAFPLWLSPLQIVVLPIGESHIKYAKEVYEKIKNSGVRTEIDESGETLGRKIRNGKLKKVPYMIVIGDKEVKDKKITLESRDSGSLGQMSVENMIEKLKKEIAEKK